MNLKKPHPRLRTGRRNSPEYQKAMRQMRRRGIPKDLADSAALQATYPKKQIMDFSGGE